MTILSFLLVIGPLIFIHELGHYFVGRWFGVKADTFSIGFGREIGGWTDKRGTRWKIGWMPLGGYVKFKGDMNPASQPSDEWLALPPEEQAQCFQARPLWQRFLIVAAGPVTNFLFAILAFVAIFAAIGYPTTPAVVNGIVEAGAADRAGLRPGDRIVKADGQGMDIFADLQSYVRLRPAQSITFTVERDGTPMRVAVVTDSRVMRDTFGNEARVGSLGITSGPPSFARLAPAQLLGAAVDQTVETVRAMVVALGQVSCP